jgi:hypothetical protein
VNSNLYNYGRLRDPEGVSPSTFIMSRERIRGCKDCFDGRSFLYDLPCQRGASQPMPQRCQGARGNPPASRPRRWYPLVGNLQSNSTGPNSLDQGCTFVTDRIAVLTQIAKNEDESDVSKAGRDLVRCGRVLPGVERYKNGEASSGKAAEAAGRPVGLRMTRLGEFGVRSRIEETDYRQSLANLAKVCHVLQAGLKKMPMIATRLSKGKYLSNS